LEIAHFSEDGEPPINIFFNFKFVGKFQTFFNLCLRLSSVTGRRERAIYYTDTMQILDSIEYKLYMNIKYRLYSIEYRIKRLTKEPALDIVIVHCVRHAISYDYYNFI